MNKFIFNMNPSFIGQAQEALHTVLLDYPESERVGVLMKSGTTFIVWKNKSSYTISVKGGS